MSRRVAAGGLVAAALTVGMPATMARADSAGSVALTVTGAVHGHYRERATRHDCTPFDVPFPGEAAYNSGSDFVFGSGGRGPEVQISGDIDQTGLRHDEIDLKTTTSYTVTFRPTFRSGHTWGSGFTGTTPGSQIHHDVGSGELSMATDARSGTLRTVMVPDTGHASGEVRLTVSWSDCPAQRR